MRHHIENAKKNETKNQDQMLDVVTVVDDGDDARRAPQGIILVVLSQFLTAFGTNYFLRVIPTK
jgi:hypothetical protein